MARIFVDLDDVLGQTALMFLEVLQAEFGRRAELGDLSTYHLGQSLNLDEAELADFLRVTHEPERLLAIEPMPGADAVLRRWLAAGHQVFVVSGRPAETRETTVEWLRRSGTPYTEFHLLDKYSRYYGSTDGVAPGTWRLEDLPAMEFALAVEDFPGTALHLAQELSVPVALFDRPWNRGVAESPDAGPMVRCASWLEIGERFPLAG